MAASTDYKTVLYFKSFFDPRTHGAKQRSSWLGSNG